MRSLIFERACNEGTYESALVQIIKGLIKDNTWYIDVGANIGLMSVPILNAISNCNVLSYEPSPNAVPWLKRTLGESKWKERWSVIDKAISDNSASIEFHVSKESLGAYDGAKDTKRSGLRGKVRVESTTLDLEWEKFGKPRISVVKIDVEGAELSAIKGALRMVESEQPNILIEWTTVNFTAYDCAAEDMLIQTNNIGYVMYALPYMYKIESKKDLELQMLVTESFLLSPK